MTNGRVEPALESSMLNFASHNVLAGSEGMGRMNLKSLQIQPGVWFDGRAFA